MLKPSAERKSDQTKPAKNKIQELSLKFLFTWLFFVTILFLITPLFDINWAKPQIEEAMSQSLKRRVELAPIHWSFGLRGFSFSTSAISISEDNGTPFVKGGRAEIGVAFIPLCKGKIVLRNITFSKASVWLTRQSKDKWNFSDLITTGPDIRLVELKDSTVVITDTYTSPANKYRLTNFRTRFVFPRKTRSWPFELSFALERPLYTTKVELKVVGRGLYKDWQKNKYDFVLKSENFNADDYQPYLPTLANLHGPVNFSLKSDGIFENGMPVNFLLNAKQLELEEAVIGKTSLQEPKIKAILKASPSGLKVEQLNLVAKDSTVDFQGSLANCFSTNALLTGKIKGNIDRVENFVRYCRLGNVKSLAGKAVLDIELNNFAVARLFDTKTFPGSAKPFADSSVHARIQMNSMPTAALVSFLNLTNFSPHSMQNSQSLLKASVDLQTRPDGQIQVNSGTASIDNSSLKVQGLCDWKFNPLDLAVDGENLNLAHIFNSLSVSEKKSLGVKIGLSSLHTAQLTGRASIHGKIKSGYKPDFVISLNDTNLSFGNSGVDFNSVSGDITVDQDCVTIQSVSGVLDGGKLDLKAKVFSADRKVGALSLAVSKLDSEDLVQVLNLLNLKLPLISEGTLCGRIQNMQFFQASSLDKNNFQLSLEPVDLNFAPPGLTKPIHAVSGKICFNHGDLSIKDAVITSKQSKALLNVSIKNLYGEPDVDSFSLSSSNIDLQELHYYLQSAVTPSTLRDQYNHLLAEASINTYSGKAVLDLKLEPKAKGFPIVGYIALNKFETKIGPRQIPLSSVSGIIALTPFSFLLQNISGNIGSSNFSLDGHLVSIHRNSSPLDRPFFQAGLSLDLNPQDLCYIDNSDRSFKLTAKRITSINANLVAAEGALSGSFDVRAPECSYLCLETGNLTMSAPETSALFFKTNFVVSPQKDSIQFDQCKLTIGRHKLDGSVALELKEEKVVDSTITLSTDGAFPVTLFQEIFSDQADSLSKISPQGLLKGKLTLTRHEKDNYLDGQIGFDNMAMEESQLGHISGEAEFKHFPVNYNDGSRLKESGQIELKLKALNYKKAKFENIRARIVISDEKQSKQYERLLQVKELSADIGSGKVNAVFLSNLSKGVFELNCTLNNADSNVFLKEFFDLKDEVSGKMVGNVSLSGKFKEGDPVMKSLSGKGEISIYNGKVARFGTLQEKLNQANLLQQGLFGFNLNNLLQTVVPVRTGNFNELYLGFLVQAGKMQINDLHFSGQDMRLRAAGDYDIASGELGLEVAGNIPRVSSSLIGGTMGEVSKKFTIQRLLKILTFKKLENLPTLPILGDIASDHPRAFSFKVKHNKDDNQDISRSIEKSFAWLPSKPTATAHPIPGL